VSLVGGGEVTVLPQGIDIEALRTGGAGGMFFGIDRARYVARQLLGGPRHVNVVTIAPAIEGKLLYVRRGDRTLAVRAGGEIPSRSRALGAGLDLLDGRWEDTPADSAYVRPTPQQLYDQLDHFHLPRRADSTWAEWHYFNVVSAPDEWWYITYLVGGEVPSGRWRGGLLLTRRRAGGRYDRFTLDVPPLQVAFDTAKADLRIGDSFVRQRDGSYTLEAHARGDAGPVSVDLVLQPLPNRYFPPAELGDEAFQSGYVVPALAGSASGRICVAGRCTRLNGAPAYHDHNWGVWRDVTWEWGAARGAKLSLLYGGIYGSDQSTSPFILALVDSLGVRQVLRFNRIDYRGERPSSSRTDRAPDVTIPATFSLVARRDADTVRLDVTVDDALATRGGPAALERSFLQMRGRFTLRGRVAGQLVADTGAGFFETYKPSRTTKPAER
jgi:hypothetical protein